MIAAGGSQTRLMETSETKLIQIVLNGRPRDVPQGLALDALLAFLAVKPDRVAIERNRAIVRKPDWPVTAVEPGDRLEIVWFVGGGSDPRSSAFIGGRFRDRLG